MSYGFNTDKSKCEITNKIIIQPQSGETYGGIVVRLWNTINAMETDAYKIVRIVFHVSSFKALFFEPPEINKYGYPRPSRLNGFNDVSTSSVTMSSLHLAADVASLPDYIVSYANIYNENGTTKLSISNQYGKNVNIPTGDNACSFEIHYTA